MHALALRRPRDHHASPPNGLRALLAFPGELEKLRADPSLAPAAVEELLRYDGPIGAQVRIVQEPHTLHGKALRRASACSCLMNAANRDPRAYPNPTDSTCGATACRTSLSASAPTSVSASRSPGWKGRSRCPACSARWRRLEIAAEPQWMDSMVLRGMKAMPLRVAR